MAGHKWGHVCCWNQPVIKEINQISHWETQNVSEKSWDALYLLRKLRDDFLKPDCLGLGLQRPQMMTLYLCQAKGTCCEFTPSLHHVPFDLAVLSAPKYWYGHLKWWCTCIKASSWESHSQIGARLHYRSWFAQCMVICTAWHMTARILIFWQYLVTHMLLPPWSSYSN